MSQSRKEKMEGNRATSLAWKMNLANQWRRFLDFILAGILFFVFACILWAVNAEQLDEAAFLQFFESLKKPYLWSVGLMFLWWAVGFLNGTDWFRPYLKSLDELALAAEEISKKGSTIQGLSDLEEAIEHVSGTSPKLVLESGDAELKSLEAAINNMLRRLHSSYRQQIRFVDDASHELRTPIAVIQGYINMLDRWGKSDPQILEEGIEAIKAEAEHMNILVEQLLFLARGDAGRQKFELKECNLPGMMEEIAEESRMIDEKHRYELQISDCMIAMGDYAMLKQSVRILIDNASKYSQENTKISLRLYRRAEGEVCIEVQDQGSGISKQDIDHIFERLYRGDPARNSKSGGSGLGLAIADWIVRRHSGRIEVLSYEGIGSRFTIVIPEKTIAV